MENHFSLIPSPSIKIFFCLVNENFKCKSCFNPSKNIYLQNEYLEEEAEKKRRKIEGQRGKRRGIGETELYLAVSCVVLSGGREGMCSHRINNDILWELGSSGHLSTCCPVSEIIKILNLIHCLEIALKT